MAIIPSIGLIAQAITHIAPKNNSVASEINK